MTHERRELAVDGEHLRTLLEMLRRDAGTDGKGFSWVKCEVCAHRWVEDDAANAPETHAGWCPVGPLRADVEAAEAAYNAAD